MEKIKVITDSTSDLPLEIIEKYDIEVIPLLITFGEDSYKDGVDIDIYQLLEKMRYMNEFPVTSQVIPKRFLEYYEKYINEGYKIISIHLSSKMSGTYQSACMAKEMLQSEDIVVIDSLNVTSGLGLLVIKAAKLKEKNLNIKQIEEEIKKLIPHVKSALVFNSLENLVKGGRLSKTAGVVGNILAIKPIMAVENGEVIVRDKVRGSKKVVRTILDYLDKKGIRDNETSMLLDIESKDIDTLREALKRKNREFIECKVGCTVGVHAGEDACGVFFIEDF
jgi:DegV family protein with EDD domain